MKTIAKFDNAFSANIAKGVLAEEGIESLLVNENLIWSIGLYNTGGLALELRVEEEDYDRALEILNAVPQPLPDDFEEEPNEA